MLCWDSLLLSNSIKQKMNWNLIILIIELFKLQCRSQVLLVDVAYYFLNVVCIVEVGAYELHNFKQGLRRLKIIEVVYENVFAVRFNELILNPIH